VPTLRAGAGREGRANEGAGRKAAFADHRLQCSERSRGLPAPHRRDHCALRSSVSERGEIHSTRPTRRPATSRSPRITGVGSSALGSAALAWNVSAALERPVLAIVPGYGVADVVLQALGGWSPSVCMIISIARTLIRTGLATAAPEDRARRPRARRIDASGADHWRRPDFSLRLRVRRRASRFARASEQHPLSCSLGTARGRCRSTMRSDPFRPNVRRRAARGHAWGCPIGEEAAGVEYHQYLGLFRALGQLNAWGHRPNHWPPSGTATNPVLRTAMAAGEMTSQSTADRRRAKARRRRSQDGSPSLQPVTSRAPTPGFWTPTARIDRRACRSTASTRARSSSWSHTRACSRLRY
jgi:hypothetical protein